MDNVDILEIMQEKHLKLWYSHLVLMKED